MTFDEQVVEVLRRRAESYEGRAAESLREAAGFALGYFADGGSFARLEEWSRLARATGAWQSAVAEVEKQNAAGAS